MLEKGWVILLHGLGRTHRSMRKLAHFLQKEGYKVVNLSYPSRTRRIEELAEQYVGKALEMIRKEEANLSEKLPVHFVTHSMGGILIRQYLQHNDIPGLSRIVMLAPPNQGSELADFFSRHVFFRFLLGKPITQLGKGGLPGKLDPLSACLGIIAGKSRCKPIFSFLFNEHSDGKVSISSTQLPEMSDYIQVSKGHTFIMNDPLVQSQIIYFLASGRFDRST